MKLIKVEAEGFKSFADKISLSFDGGVVGIVGPNGSGKSNINDVIISMNRIKGVIEND